MTRISLTKDAAHVLFTLLDRYKSSGHPCFKFNHEDICEGDPKVCSDCKHGKALQRISTALHKAGYP